MLGFGFDPMSIAIRQGGGAAQNPNLVEEGGWGPAAGITQNGNQFTFTDVAQNLSTGANILTISENYEWELVISDLTTGAIRFGNDSSALFTATANGTYSGTFTATAAQARLTARNAVTNGVALLTVRLAS